MLRNTVKVVRGIKNLKGKSSLSVILLLFTYKTNSQCQSKQSKLIKTQNPNRIGRFVKTKSKLKLNQQWSKTKATFLRQARQVAWSSGNLGAGKNEPYENKNDSFFCLVSIRKIKSLISDDFSSPSLLQKPDHSGKTRDVQVKKKKV